MIQTRFRLHPSFHFLLALLVSVPLVWLDLQSIELGFWIVGLLLLYGFLFALGVVAAVRMRRSLWYVSCFVIILLFALYQTRLAEGHAVLYADDCDFSVCNEYRFGSNGVWRHVSWSQQDQRSEIGTYRYRNDTLFLYRNGACFSFSAATALERQIEKGFVILVREGEKRYTERLDRIDEKWVYSFTPSLPCHE